jgi:hypothetical protein
MIQKLVSNVRSQLYFLLYDGWNKFFLEALCLGVHPQE